MSNNNTRNTRSNTDLSDLELFDLPSPETTARISSTIPTTAQQQAATSDRADPALARTVPTPTRLSFSNNETVNTTSSKRDTPSSTHLAASLNSNSNPNDSNSATNETASIPRNDHTNNTSAITAQLSQFSAEEQQINQTTKQNDKNLTMTTQLPATPITGGTTLAPTAPAAPPTPPPPPAGPPAPAAPPIATTINTSQAKVPLYPMASTSASPYAYGIDATTSAGWKMITTGQEKLPTASPWNGDPNTFRPFHVALRNRNEEICGDQGATQVGIYDLLEDYGKTTLANVKTAIETRLTIQRTSVDPVLTTPQDKQKIYKASQDTLRDNMLQKCLMASITTDLAEQLITSDTFADASKDLRHSGTFTFSCLVHITNIASANGASIAALKSTLDKPNLLKQAKLNKDPTSFNLWLKQQVTHLKSHAEEKDNLSWDTLDVYKTFKGGQDWNHFVNNYVSNIKTGQTAVPTINALMTSMNATHKHLVEAGAWDSNEQAASDPDDNYRIALQALAKAASPNKKSSSKKGRQDSSAKSSNREYEDTTPEWKLVAPAAGEPTVNVHKHKPGTTTLFTDKKGETINWNWCPHHREHGMWVMHDPDACNRKAGTTATKDKDNKNAKDTEEAPKKHKSTPTHPKAFAAAIKNLPKQQRATLETLMSQFDDRVNSSDDDSSTQASF